MLAKIAAYYAAKGPKRWALWMYISLGVLAAGTVFYFWYSKKKREIAKLKLEAAKASIDAENARYAMVLTSDEAELDRLREQSNEYQHQAAQLRTQIATEEQQVAKRLKAITELKSWEDIDKYNKQGRS